MAAPGGAGKLPEGSCLSGDYLENYYIRVFSKLQVPKAKKKRPPLPHRKAAWPEVLHQKHQSRSNPARRPLAAKRLLPEGLQFSPQRKSPYPANEPPAAKARTLVSGSTNPRRHLAQPPGAISRNTLVIDQGTAHHGPRPVGEIRRLVGQPPKAGAFGRFPGPGGIPGRSLVTFCRNRK